MDITTTPQEWQELMGKDKYFPLAILALLIIPSAKAQQNAQGWCGTGPQLVVTSGVPPNKAAQSSYPFCYNVYQWGGYTGPNYNGGTTGSIVSGSNSLTIGAAAGFCQQ